MFVCGHGNVKNYCDGRDMIIVENHDGGLDGYSGICRVVVTDQDMSENEYLYLKKKMLLSGVELVSVWYTDNEDISRHIMYTIQLEREARRKKAGRCLFGQHRVNGEVVPHEEGMKIVRRIIELRDKGLSYRGISNDENVHDLTGRKLGTSTIALIVKNRERYGL